MIPSVQGRPAAVRWVRAGRQPAALSVSPVTITLTPHPTTVTRHPSSVARHPAPAFLGKPTVNKRCGAALGPGPAPVSGVTKASQAADTGLPHDIHTSPEYSATPGSGNGCLVPAGQLERKEGPLSFCESVTQPSLSRSVNKAISDRVNQHPNSDQNETALLRNALKRTLVELIHHTQFSLIASLFQCK